MQETTSNPPAATRDMLGRSRALPLAEALARLHGRLSECRPTGPESIPLARALGRILAQPVRAPHDLPTQPRSTMDGYAVRAADTFGARETMPVYLKISGEVKMGTLPDCSPRAQECFKIATGGFLPPATDAVLMLEHTVTVDHDLIEAVKPVSTGANVLARGDDLGAGELILAAGCELLPQALGLLAGCGITEVAVHRKVRVGIFSTGDEIVPFDQAPPPGKIRDMNAITLNSLAEQEGALCRLYGIIPDNEETFTATLNRVVADNDLVLFSGSSSVGARDLGERVIERTAEPGIIIHGVAIKPGKPVIIAFAGDKPVFGLPGHPVSAAVAFDLFVRPAIRYLAGRPNAGWPEKTSVQARLRRNLNSAPGRTDFLRVRLEKNVSEEFEAWPVLGKSGALSTMVRADGYIVIDQESQGLYEGEEVEVFLF